MSARPAAKAIASRPGLTFARIQFTPDMRPAMSRGRSIFDSARP
ncbi:MAG: AAA family ATPase [Actinomycetales bacterium]|nr:AAA family ATPase [Actinomycetales bacterium]